VAGTDWSFGLVQQNAGADPISKFVKA